MYKKQINDYILNQAIGKGQYGKVYDGTNVKDNKKYAIKQLKAYRMSEIQKMNEFLKNEIANLKKLSNNINIVKFIEYFKHDNHLYMVYEYCNGGTLDDYLLNKGTLEEKMCLQIFMQLVNGFKDIHQELILHRDIKPSNVLIDYGENEDLIIKIADFGFCKSIDSKQQMTQTMVGSPIYMAPEVLKGEDYGYKADVWSCGVLLYELIFGKCPFEDKSIPRLINTINRNSLTFPKKIHGFTQQLLKGCLQKEGVYRASWEEIFKLFTNTDMDNIFDEIDKGIDSSRQKRREDRNQNRSNETNQINQVNDNPSIQNRQRVNGELKSLMNQRMQLIEQLDRFKIVFKSEISSHLDVMIIVFLTIFNRVKQFQNQLLVHRQSNAILDTLTQENKQIMERLVVVSQKYYELSEQLYKLYEKQSNRKQLYYILTDMLKKRIGGVVEVVNIMANENGNQLASNTNTSLLERINQLLSKEEQYQVY